MEGEGEGDGDGAEAECERPDDVEVDVVDQTHRCVSPLRTQALHKLPGSAPHFTLRLRHAKQDGARAGCLFDVAFEYSCQRRACLVPTVLEAAAVVESSFSLLVFIFLCQDYFGPFKGVGLKARDSVCEINDFVSHRRVAWLRLPIKTSAPKASPQNDLSGGCRRAGSFIKHPKRGLWYGTVAVITGLLRTLKSLTLELQELRTTQGWRTHGFEPSLLFAVAL